MDEVEVFETQIAAHIAINPDPETFVKETVEQGTKIMRLCDEIEEIWNQYVFTC